VKLQYSTRDLHWFVLSCALATAFWISALKRGMRIDAVCFLLTLSAGTATGIAVGSLFRKQEIFAGIGLLSSAWLYFILLLVS
jgi:hypothetical protein